MDIFIEANISGFLVTTSIPIFLNGFNAASLAITSISAPVYPSNYSATLCKFTSSSKL